MKKLLIILFLLLLSPVVWAINYCSGDAKACWLFNEGTGTTTSDSTGNGNTGTLTSVSWSNSPLPSRSYITWATSYNGSTSQISTGATSNQFPTNGTAFSFVAWVYDIAGDGATNPRRIIDKSSGATGPSISLSGNTSTAGIELIVGGSTQLNRQCSTAISSNAWHHIEVTWDGSTTAANAHIYYDGGTECSYQVTQNGASFTDNSASNNIIGFRNAGTATRDWDGYLAEMAVFNRVLSSTEITDIYNNGLGVNSSVTHTDIIQGSSIIQGASVIN